MPKEAQKLEESIHGIEETLNDIKKNILKRNNDAIMQGDYETAKKCIDVSSAIDSAKREAGNLLSLELSTLNLTTNDSSSKDNPLPNLQGPRLNQIPHTLRDDMTSYRPKEFMLGSKSYTVRNWNSLYVKVLELLYREDQAKFNTLVHNSDFRGSKRWYFSNIRSEINKPKEILDSGIYVTQAISYKQISEILSRLFYYYKKDIDDLKIYLVTGYKMSNKRKRTQRQNLKEEELDMHVLPSFLGINVVHDNDINKKELLCPQCKSSLHKISIKVRDKETRVTKKLQGYQCSACNNKFIKNAVYTNFIKSHNIDNLTIE